MKPALIAACALACALVGVEARANPAGPGGDDFAAQAAELYRIGACGGDAPVPARWSAARVERHCKAMRLRYASYKRAWADRAQAFIAGLRPAGLPTTVVYPFGGGDLNSALVVFPDATEITTISLEAAGDIRALDGLDQRGLDRDLAAIGKDIGRLYRAAYSTTKTLQGASHSRLPGTIMFALAALAVHGLQPVSLRYFDVEPDGSLRYLTGAELDQRAAAAAAAAPVRPGPRAELGPGTVRRLWHEQRSVFANVEIEYVPLGAPTDRDRRVYRHIVANLDDAHLGPDRRVLVHLAGKGKVAVMTKAASFLLWYDDFALIRTYLLDHLAWMISDASGIPPRYAAPAGLEQITYGQFTSAYFVKDPNGVRAEMVALWRGQPRRPLGFRFGYPDGRDHAHLMITRPRAP